MTKRLSTLAAAALLLYCSRPAAAQQYGPLYLAATNGGSITLNGGTNVVSAATTNTCNSPITLTKSDYVSLDLGYKYSGASSANMTFRFAYSVNGTDYESTPSLVYNLAGNGTTAVRDVKQITGVAAGYLRLTTIENTNASVVATNVVVGYSLKPKRQ